MRISKNIFFFLGALKRAGVPHLKLKFFLLVGARRGMTYG